MKPLNGFVASIFLSLLITPLFTHAQSKNCSKVNVTIDITHSSNGQQGSIKVSASDASAKFMLHLLNDRGENEQVKITTGTIRNIPPGTYDLVIHYPDAKYCSETRKVTVN